MYLELVLKGEGVSPTITVTPDDDRMDYGHIMSGDKCTNTLRLDNSSKLALRYQFVLESAKPKGQKC